MPKGKRTVAKQKVPVENTVKKVPKKRGRPVGSFKKPKGFQIISCKLCSIPFRTIHEKRQHDFEDHHIEKEKKRLNVRNSDGRVVTFHLNTNEKGFMCPQCDLDYATVGGIWWHIKKHLIDLGPEQMKGITKVMPSNGIAESIISHQDIGVGVNKQDNEQDNGQDRNEAIEEQKMRVRVSTPKIPCIACQLSFDDEKQLKIHKYAYHKLQYFLVLESNFDEKFHFIVVRNYDFIKCPLCNCKSRSISVLDNHLQTRHSMAVWITQEELKNYGVIVSNKEQDNEDLSYLYQPALTFYPQKQESSLWKTIKSVFWS